MLCGQVLDTALVQLKAAFLSMIQEGGGTVPIALDLDVFTGR